VAAPTTLEALLRGARAAGRSGWLVAPALLVAFLRAALLWPALLFAVAMARLGFLSRLAGGLASPPALLASALAAVTAPRTLYTLGGLWLAGLCAAAALRIAFWSGALPTLGGELAAEAPRPRFAEGFAFGFARLLGTALLGFVFELLAQACATAAALASLALALVRPGGLRALFPASVGALALALALALLLLGALGADAALARTALRGERAVHAFALALARVLARPGAFAFAALALGLAGAMVTGSVEAVEAAALGMAKGAPLVLVLGPRVMAGVLGAGLAALLELWRIASIAALACGEEG